MTEAEEDAQVIGFSVEHGHLGYTPAVLDYFKRHGLPIPENVVFS